MCISLFACVCVCVLRWGEPVGRREGKGVVVDRGKGKSRPDRTVGWGWEEGAGRRGDPRLMGLAGGKVGKEEGGPGDGWVGETRSRA